MILLADPRVRWIWDQPPSITYVDDCGQSRRHTFDFLAVLNNGKRIAFVVKPHRRAEKYNVAKQVEIIRGQIPAFVADNVLLRTESHISKVHYYNALLILSCWKTREVGIAKDVAKLITNLVGHVKVGDLVSASRLGGDGFREIACLVGDGILKTRKPERLDYTSHVSLAA